MLWHQQRKSSYDYFLCPKCSYENCNIIKFPQRIDECRTLCNGFEKFPKTIGCVDGTCIPMTGKSQEKRNAYICRQGYCAMHVQMTCESNLKTIDITTGYPGSVGDARVFRNIPIFEKMQTLQDFHFASRRFGKPIENGTDNTT
ncbi:nuclease harbi1 [Plakobranchus ocellatus]|uniref:Nuclease harbi1 n=1 Tax=Plakobranchus ocellatus TaxID=259542 RepID=A0AAV4DFE0_9GAST|nr:nuclease harbi1 [Plakobranchus ocellatus]